MDPMRPVGEQEVRALASAADLAVPDDRLPLIASQLGGWLEAANELNRKMSAAQHRTVTPVTVFLHPGISEHGE